MRQAEWTFLKRIESREKLLLHRRPRRCKPGRLLGFLLVPPLGELSHIYLCWRLAAFFWQWCFTLEDLIFWLVKKGRLLLFDFNVNGDLFMYEYLVSLLLWDGSWTSVYANHLHWTKYMLTIPELRSWQTNYEESASNYMMWASSWTWMRMPDQLLRKRLSEE